MSKRAKIKRANSQPWKEGTGLHLGKHYFSGTHFFVDEGIRTALVKNHYMDERDQDKTVEKTILLMKGIRTALVKILFNDERDQDCTGEKLFY